MRFLCLEQNISDLMMNIRLYLEPGHTVHCCRGVLELEPLLQQVATICKVKEGVVTFHVVPVFCQEEDKNEEYWAKKDYEQSE